MADTTKIEWADKTWSPWIGCQKVGPGCDHCYAEALNKRAGHANWGPGAPRRRTSKDYWRQPYRWNTAGPATVFPSMCDPFDNAVARELRIDFGRIIRETPNLTWLLLSKRIGNALDMLPEMFPGGVPANVWVGSTFVNQPEIDRDGDKLAEVKRRFGVRTFGSFEPLLGPVDRLPSELDWAIVGGESGGGARPMHPDWARSLRDQCTDAGVPFLFKQWGEWREWDSGSPEVEEIDNSSETADTIFSSAVRPAFITSDGTFIAKRADLPEEVPARLIERAGKKATGRLLDGVTHDGFPADLRRAAHSHPGDPHAQ